MPIALSRVDSTRSSTVVGGFSPAAGGCMSEFFFVALTYAGVHLAKGRSSCSRSSTTYQIQRFSNIFKSRHIAYPKYKIFQHIDAIVQ
jgi:hypothetical protein